MRNIWSRRRKADYGAVKVDAQPSTRRKPAENESGLRSSQYALEEAVFVDGAGSWNTICPSCLEFFSFAEHLWRKLRTTNNRCCAEGRRNSESNSTPFRSS
jgi:hypothetical protein